MPVLTLATLAAGLGPDSRVGMAVAGTTAPRNTIMLANLYDAVNMLAYGLGGGKGEKPECIAERFLKEEHETKSDVMTFSSGKDFEAYREKLLRGVK